MPPKPRARYGTIIFTVAIAVVGEGTTVGIVAITTITTAVTVVRGDGMPAVAAAS